jgi:hypothetical protein
MARSPLFDTSIQHDNSLQNLVADPDRTQILEQLELQWQKYMDQNDTPDQLFVWVQGGEYGNLQIEGVAISGRTRGGDNEVATIQVNGTNGCFQIPIETIRQFQVMY